MPLRHITRVSEMAQQEKRPAAKHKGQSLSCNTQIVVTFTNFPLTSVHTTYVYFKTNTPEELHLKSVPKFTSL